MDMVPHNGPVALVPNLLAAANAAGNLMRRHQYDAGGHLMDSYGSRLESGIHRRLADQHAVEAYAARIERRHLFAAYRAGGVS